MLASHFLGCRSSGWAMLAEMSGHGLDAEAPQISNRPSDPHVDVRPKRSANVVYCQVPPLVSRGTSHRCVPRLAVPLGGPGLRWAGGLLGSSPPGAQPGQTCGQADQLSVHLVRH